MAARKVQPVTTALPSVFYEDPEPVEDGMQQAPIIVDIAHMLTAHFRSEPEVFVSAGGFIFYDPDTGNRRIAPDLYIAFDVDAEGIWQNLPNYWIWQVGKAPNFVMEVASPSTASNDLGHKRDLYARLGIAEYWRLDPTGGDLYGQPLSGDRLADGEYRPCELKTDVDGAIWAFSEVLGLRICWDYELENQFDVRDPATGRTIDPSEVERDARLAAEEELLAERRALLVERQALYEEREARLKAEAREREMLSEIERLRGQLPEA